MAKKILVFFVVLLISIAATPPKHSKKSNYAKNIEGTWELVSHYIYDGEKVTDTVFADEGYRQIKMFYNGKVMWTRFVPSVSAEWFGYGSYSTKKNKLRETLEYGSATMMQMQDTIGMFEFELVIEDDRYSQITLDANGKRIHSENYKRVDDTQKELFSAK